MSGRDQTQKPERFSVIQFNSKYFINPRGKLLFSYSAPEQVGNEDEGKKNTKGGKHK